MVRTTAAKRNGALSAGEASNRSSPSLALDSIRDMSTSDHFFPIEAQKNATQDFNLSNDGNSNAGDGVESNKLPPQNHSLHSSRSHGSLRSQSGSTSTIIRAGASDIQNGNDLKQSISSEYLLAQPTTLTSTVEHQHRLAKKSSQYFSHQNGTDSNSHTSSSSYGESSKKSHSMRNSVKLLSSHPMLDTLTLFILIVQCPKLVITLAHLIYTGLTFNLPPNNNSFGVHYSSLWSSITYATPMHPSVLTILLADFVTGIITVFCMPRLRSIIFDLGSAVIASVLGGGSSKTAVYCMMLLQTARILKQWWFLLRRGAYPFEAPTVTTTPPVSVLSAGEFAASSTPLANSVSHISDAAQYLYSSSTSSSRRWDLIYGPAGWFSQAVAIHIVAQSLMYSIRRRFLENNNKLSSMPAASSSPGLLGDGYGIDCETAASYVNTPVSYSMGSNGQSLSSSKKRKKSNVLANKPYQQSLWTALANSLVLASRDSSQLDASMYQPLPITESSNLVDEKELNASTKNTMLSSAAQDDLNAVGMMGFRGSEDMPSVFCCIHYILENEVAFELTADLYSSGSSSQADSASTLSQMSIPGSQSMSNLLPVGSSLVPSIFSHNEPSQQQSPQSSKAIYADISVRVNGILWPEVSVQTIVPKLLHPAINGHTTSPSPEVEVLEGQVADSSLAVSSSSGTTVRNGLALSDAPAEYLETILVVSGLTPITEYEIEITKTFRNGKNITLCRTNICTSPKEASSISSQQQPSRPLSPVTTLLDTLCTTNATLTEEKHKLKRSRREHSKHLSALRSEIDQLKGRLGSGDKGEERAWRRVLALREAVRRTEEEIEVLSKKSEDVEIELKEVEKRVNSKKCSWEKKMKELEAREFDLEERSMEIDKKLKALQSEEAASYSKRDKLSGRHKKLLADFERADQARRNAWNEEFARRRLEREKLSERRHAIEEEFSNAITKMEKGIDDIREKTASTWQSISLISESLNRRSPLSSVSNVGVPVSPMSPPATYPRERSSSPSSFASPPSFEE
ncbi:hypothetical protein V1511DRAFT_496288 [Dipodascopsis uninucleata]